MGTETSTSATAYLGARWVRAALQVNPYDYQGNPSPASVYPDEASYNEALLDECDKLGISLLATTDHWCATSAAGLIVDAAARGVTVLPGFEATTSEGIHLLVIFERDTKLDNITIAIGACGLTPGDPHAVAEKSYSEIVKAMTSRGALVIPAHVNVANSGLLHRAVGKPLEPMIKNTSIQALGITPSAPEAGDQVKILKNKAPFRRKHPLIAIHADDIMSPAALASEGGSSWFKMCEPTLAGLKHALRTPQTRVSLADPASTAPQESAADYRLTPVLFDMPDRGEKACPEPTRGVDWGFSSEVPRYIASKRAPLAVVGGLASRGARRDVWGKHIANETIVAHVVSQTPTTMGANRLARRCQDIERRPRHA